MAFNGKEGRPITLDVAKKWTSNWREANKGKVKGIFYGKDNIMDLLNQSGAMGIRVYFALDDEGNNKLVLVAADAEEANIYGDEGKDGGAPLLDDGATCPTNCPPPSDPLTN